MTQNNQSFLDKLIKMLTKSTPVERESEVKLDHNFDGIEELNNPLPPWWSAGFVITVVISIFYIGFYFMYYYDQDKLGKWQETEYQKEVAEAQAKIEKYKKEHGIVDENTVTVLTDAKALEEGKEIYMKNCASCHAPDGGGGIGPNLTDDNWIHGCDIKSLYKVIHDGVLSKGMPAWKNLGSQNIQKVASYILSLHGTKPANPKQPQGEVCKNE